MLLVDPEAGRLPGSPSKHSRPGAPKSSAGSQGISPQTHPDASISGDLCPGGCFVLFWFVLLALGIESMSSH